MKRGILRTAQGKGILQVFGYYLGSVDIGCIV